MIPGRSAWIGLRAAAALALGLLAGGSLMATSPGDTMHVQDVTVVIDGDCKAWARVLVADQNGVGVEGATVSGEWTGGFGCRGGRRSAVTDAGGVATVRGTSCRRSCWWGPTAEFQVTAVEHDVAAYAPAANVESSASETAFSCIRSGCGWD